MIVDQTAFRAALLDPKAERPEGLTDGTGAPAGRRFDVYRNNVAVSLTEALETAFPVLRKLVGDANFKTLSGIFLRAHPPSSPMMMYYGAEMPAFLATFEPAKSLPYLPDVARLELALRESYHAADSAPVDHARLEALTPDDLMTARLSLAPSARLIRSNWPIHAIWRRNTEDDAPKPVVQAEDVLILRAEFDPKPHLLPTGGGALVAALIDGAKLGEAIETAGDTTALPSVLSLLIAHGGIIDIGG